MATKCLNFDSSSSIRQAHRSVGGGFLCIRLFSLRDVHNQVWVGQARTVQVGCVQQGELLFRSK